MDGSKFDPGNPIANGDLIEDEDGAPLPHELQRCGRISRAVWDALNGSIQDDVPIDAAHEAVLAALAPILWPLLPSNDHSAAAAMRMSEPQQKEQG